MTSLPRVGSGNARAPSTAGNSSSKNDSSSKCVQAVGSRATRRPWRTCGRPLILASTARSAGTAEQRQQKGRCGPRAAGSWTARTGRLPQVQVEGLGGRLCERHARPAGRQAAGDELVLRYGRHHQARLAVRREHCGRGDVQSTASEPRCFGKARREDARSGSIFLLSRPIQALSCSCVHELGLDDPFPSTSFVGTTRNGAQYESVLCECDASMKGAQRKQVVSESALAAGAGEGAAHLADEAKLRGEGACVSRGVARTTTAWRRTVPDDDHLAVLG